MNKSVKIQVELSDKANLKIGIYRISNRFKTKAQAINHFIENK